MQYVQDFDETYPKNYLEDPVHGRILRWRAAIFPYVKNGTPFTHDGTVGGIPTGANRGIYDSPNAPSESNHNYGVNPTIMPSGGAQPATMGDVTAPADKVLIFTQGVNQEWNSGADEIFDFEFLYSDGNRVVGPSTVSGDNDIPGKTASDGNPAKNDWAGPWMPRYRYNIGMNVAYADGHAKWMRRGQLNYCVHMKERKIPRNVFGGDQSYLWQPGGLCEAYP